MSVREAVLARLASVKKTETAAIETAANLTFKTKALPTSVASIVIKELKKAGYVVTKKAADKGSWILSAVIAKRRGVDASDAQTAMSSEINKIVSAAKKQANEDGKKPLAKAPVKKTVAKPAPKVAAKKPAASAAPAAGKAPRGTGKLKAFLKENSIDLKTLKAMVKALTPKKETAAVETAKVEMKEVKAAGRSSSFHIKGLNQRQAEKMELLLGEALKGYEMDGASADPDDFEVNVNDKDGDAKGKSPDEITKIVRAAIMDACKKAGIKV